MNIILLTDYGLHCSNASYEVPACDAGTIHTCICSYTDVVIKTGSESVASGTRALSVFYRLAYM